MASINTLHQLPASACRPKINSWMRHFSGIAGKLCLVDSPGGGGGGGAGLAAEGLEAALPILNHLFRLHLCAARAGQDKSDKDTRRLCLSRIQNRRCVLCAHVGVAARKLAPVSVGFSKVVPVVAQKEEKKRSLVEPEPEVSRTGRRRSSCIQWSSFFKLMTH